MPLSLEDAVGQKLMLSFVGTMPSADLLATLGKQHIAGVTLYRSLNVESPAQVRELSERLQHAARASEQPPLLIAADQETGTLFAIPGTTPFPGNLALGATRSPELTRRVGYAVGRELAAMGVNVNYAPVCDVNLKPDNVGVDARSFGQDPQQVALLCAALVTGLQAAGVAATAKHFPGLGDTSTDSHYALPIMEHDADRLWQVELPPFAAALDAGAKLVLTAHIALPRFNDLSDLPATLSPKILQNLLRGDMRFAGVIISDAMDMHAIDQGNGLIIDSIAALAAGVDILLYGPAQVERPDIYAAILHATRRGLISRADILSSAERILSLKAWCAQVTKPDLDVVNCGEHNALADEVAARSVTLVRDLAPVLPLRVSPDQPIAVVVPKPQDLTPADTSSYQTVELARELRAYHARVDEFTIPLNPSDPNVAALREQLSNYALVVVGTLNARQHPGQVALVEQLLASGTRLIIVALRMPYDLSCFPHAPTFLATYSIQPPSLRACASVLFGKAEPSGVIPVSISDLYPVGHGQTFA